MELRPGRVRQGHGRSWKRRAFTKHLREVGDVLFLRKVVPVWYRQSGREAGTPCSSPGKPPGGRHSSGQQYPLPFVDLIIPAYGWAVRVGQRGGGHVRVVLTVLPKPSDGCYPRANWTIHVEQNSTLPNCFGHTSAHGCNYAGWKGSCQETENIAR